MPIVVIEIALAAICSFTLVAPARHALVVAADRARVGVAIVAPEPARRNRKREGFWGGLAVMRGLGTATRSSP